MTYKDAVFINKNNNKINLIYVNIHLSNPSLNSIGLRILYTMQSLNLALSKNKYLAYCSTLKQTLRNEHFLHVKI